MRLKPYGERLIIKKKDITTTSGLYIPDSLKNSSLVGEVMEVGEAVEWAEVGDIVLFGRHSGFLIPKNDNIAGYDECILMNNDDLLAKLEG